MSKNIVKAIYTTNDKIDEIIKEGLTFQLEEKIRVAVDFSSTKQNIIAVASSYRTIFEGWAFEGAEETIRKVCEIEDAIGGLVSSIGVFRKDNMNFIIKAECKRKEDKPYINEIINSELFKCIISKADIKHLEGLTFKDLYLKEKEDKARLLKKKEKFRKSAHLIEQTLKYRFPKDRKPDLFSFLDNDKIKTEITETGRDITIEGIQLTNTESRLVDALGVLLHYNSQNENPGDDDYYAGLEIGENWNRIQYGGEDRIAPKIAFSLYELTKEFYSDKTVSGTDVENIAKVLQGLHDKKFLIVYKEISLMEGGAIRERKIEEFQQLLRILQLTETYKDRDGKITSSAEDTIVMLNPIFRAQISTKSVSYPVDINRRMLLAYGSWKVPISIIKLRDYLLLEKSNKRKTAEIYLDRLYYKINEKYMKESRKKKVKEETYTALKTMINLGLLEKYEILTGATGGQKVKFTINLDWE